MNKRNAIILLVLLLAIGFAAVSTTLFINGTISFGPNEEEFTVIFTKAIVDDIDLSNTAISDDGKTITYETKELAIIGEESILDLTVKNNSTQYDAEININCIGGANEGNYYELEYDLPDFVAAQSEIDGYVTARMIRSSVNEIIEELTCTLNVTAMERTEAAEGIIDTVSPVVSYSDEDGDGALSLGDIVSIGDEVTVGTEQFYVVSNDGTNVKMLSKYNLYVGSECVDSSASCTAYTNPTGIQDSTMLGYVPPGYPFKGVTVFGLSGTYSGSIVEGYVNTYSAYLSKTFGIENSATLMSKEELDSIIGSTLSNGSSLSSLGAPLWLYSTSYWTRSAYNTNAVWSVYSNGNFSIYNSNIHSDFGVRPVVTVSTGLFENEEEILCTVENPTVECNEEGDVCWTDSDCSTTKNIGDIVSLGTEENSVEQFYILSSNETSTKMLSMYNLYVGNERTSSTVIYTAYTNPTGIQNSIMVGCTTTQTYPCKGVTAFSSDEQKGTNYNDYSGSIVEGYVNNYSTYLANTLGIENTATLITKEELIALGCDATSSYTCTGTPSWVYSTTYWTRSAYTNDVNVWYVASDGYFGSGSAYSNIKIKGVRPLVTVSTNLI